MTSNEITLVAAVLSAVVSAIIAAIVAIFTTRYIVKHGPDYGQRIDALSGTMGDLAKTQEELRKQQAEQAEREDARYRAAQWKPTSRIIAVNEGMEHVNKLSINAVEKFRLIEASILSPTGAKIYDFPFAFGAFSDPVVGQNVRIPHQALVQLANASTTYFQLQKFEGAVRYTVERAEGDPVRYTGEVKFTAGTMMLGNTQWFDLVG